MSGANRFRAYRAYCADREWEPPELETAALYGLAGGWAEATSPFTEAAQVGVLATTLVAFGSAVGRGPYVQVGGTYHHSNENVLLAGPTATGRKGDAMTIGMRPLRLADEAWARRICRGFGSGEAIVAEVADDCAESGESSAPVDKRLLVFEDEFAGPLAVAARDGSTLSPLLRSAWDGGQLENRTRTKRKLVATGAHVSVLSAITPDELIRQVGATEIANGFLNRYLLIAVRRERLLPQGPAIPGELEAEYADAFAAALSSARKARAMRRDRPAEELWAEAYERELSVDRFGLAGAACSRAEAHALRLSMLYALLDRKHVIRRVHVEAALALWRYSERSARLVFGDHLGDPDADAIVDALAEVGSEGMTREQVGDLFSRHRSRDELDAKLAWLLRAGLVSEFTEQTGGRPARRYHLVTHEPEIDGSVA